MNRHIDTQAGTETSVQRLGQQTLKAQMAFTAVVATVCFVVMMALSSTIRADTGADIVWTATKVEGSVNYREGGHPDTRWVPLRVGALLSSLAELKTGGNGRAELSFEGSTIVAAPNSEFHLPGPTPRNAVYRVSQKVGTFLYKIKHATRDKFEVQTPYLTTIIKGTIFTVLAGPSGSSVHVTEGAVFVQPSTGSGGAFVRPGETARVTGGQRDKVTIQGANRKSGSSNAPKNDQRSDASGSSNGSTEANKGPNRVKPVKIVFRSNAPQLTSRGGNGPVNTNNRGNSGKSADIHDQSSKGNAGGNSGSNGGGKSSGASASLGGGSSSGGNGGGASASLGGGSSSGGGNGGGAGASLGGGSSNGGGNAPTLGNPSKGSKGKNG